MLGYQPLDFLIQLEELQGSKEWLNYDHFIGCTQTHVIEQLHCSRSDILFFPMIKSTTSLIFTLSLIDIFLYMYPLYNVQFWNQVKYG